MSTCWWVMHTIPLGLQPAPRSLTGLAWALEVPSLQWYATKRHCESLGSCPIKPSGGGLLHLPLFPLQGARWWLQLQARVVSRLLHLRHYNKTSTALHVRMNPVHTTEGVCIESLLRDYKTPFANNLSEWGAASLVEHSTGTGNAPP